MSSMDRDRKPQKPNFSITQLLQDTETVDWTQIIEKYENAKMFRDKIENWSLFVWFGIPSINLTNASLEHTVVVSRQPQHSYFTRIQRMMPLQLP